MVKFSIILFSILLLSNGVESDVTTGKIMAAKKKPVETGTTEAPRQVINLNEVMQKTMQEGKNTGNPTIVQGKKEEEVENPRYPRRAAVQLTARNLSQYLGEGHVWLVEIYAPWCGHCRSFEPIYNEVAAHFHDVKSKEKNVRVGKIDGDAEKALAARFSVYAYPSFYVIDGWSVYEFDGARSRNKLIQFASGGYKEQASLPFYSSPMGPLGIAQGTLTNAGYMVYDLFNWLQTTFGLSPLLAGMVLFGSCFVGCFIGIVTLAIALAPKEKQD